MKQSKKLMLVALTLLALVSCKNAAGGAGIGGTETPPKNPSNVDSLIEKLSGEGPHTLVATGNWEANDLSRLASELKKDESKEVNLDLSDVEGLETIGNSAFEGCSSLTSISLPSTVTIIGADAFYRCSNLATVTFGEGSKLAEIRMGAFEECRSLDTVTMEATNPPVLGFRVFEYTPSNLQILVPSVENYKSEEAKAKRWEPYFDNIKAKE